MADIAWLLGDGRVVGSKKKGQNAVWSNFELLCFKESGEFTGYVLCTTCKNPLKHDRSTSGTTHLKDHNRPFALHLTAHARQSDVCASCHKAIKLLQK